MYKEERAIPAQEVKDVNEKFDYLFRAIGFSQSKLEELIKRLTPVINSTKQDQAIKEELTTKCEVSARLMDAFRKVQDIESGLDYILYHLEI